LPRLRGVLCALSRRIRGITFLVRAKRCFLFERTMANLFFPSKRASDESSDRRPIQERLPRQAVDVQRDRVRR
jgi:hypothetical protein